jgi:hypothetical protein
MRGSLTVLEAACIHPLKSSAHSILAQGEEVGEELDAFSSEEGEEDEAAPGMSWPRASAPPVPPPPAPSQRPLTPTTGDAAAAPEQPAASSAAEERGQPQRQVGSLTDLTDFDWLPLREEEGTCSGMLGGRSGRRGVFAQAACGDGFAVRGFPDETTSVLCYGIECSVLWYFRTRPRVFSSRPLSAGWHAGGSFRADEAQL